MIAAARECGQCHVVSVRTYCTQLITQTSFVIKYFKSEILTLNKISNPLITFANLPPE